MNSTGISQVHEVFLRKGNEEFKSIVKELFSYYLMAFPLAAPLFAGSLEALLVAFGITTAVVGVAALAANSNLPAKVKRNNLRRHSNMCYENRFGNMQLRMLKLLKET